MPLTLQIRKVYLTGLRDSLIYGRSYLYDTAPIVIPYSQNSMRIEYSVNNFNKAHTVLYSYQLSTGGEKGIWSEYSENNMKEFTGLHEGKYVFSVKLLTDGSQEPVETSFVFEILPPWYRTWWSYLVYSVVVVLLFYYVYYRISVGRKRLLMQKELELYRQEQKFQKESDLKDQKIDSLQEENLQSELRHKSEELIRTTLNIVRKNEILLDIKRKCWAFPILSAKRIWFLFVGKHFVCWDRLIRTLSMMTIYRHSKVPLIPYIMISSKNWKKHIRN